MRQIPLVRKVVRYCQKYDESLSSGITQEVVHLGLANALSHASLAVGDNFKPRRIALPTDPIELGDYRQVYPTKTRQSA